MSSRGSLYEGRKEELCVTMVLTRGNTSEHCLYLFSTMPRSWLSWKVTQKDKEKRGIRNNYLPFLTGGGGVGFKQGLGARHDRSLFMVPLSLRIPP